MATDLFRSFRHRTRDRATPFGLTAREELPRWALIADVLTVLLLLLAISLFLTGGFREKLGPVLISLRAWERPALWAVLLLAARHLLVPSPPLPVHLWRQAVAAIRTPAMRTASQVFVATRLPVLVVGFLAVLTLGYRPGEENRMRVSDNELVNLLARFDAAYYIGIGNDGYSWNGNPLEEQNVVFFPAYPVSVRVASLLLGDTPLVAGLAVSFGAFLLALVYLYSLARQRFGEDEARATLMLLAAYPFAFFFSAIYAESLLLLGLVATFFHIERRQWVAAALWALLVGLTKPSGFLLSVPLAVMALYPTVGSRVASANPVVRGNSIPQLFAERVPFLVVAVMPLLGVLIFSAYLYGATGDALAWMHGQAAWGRNFDGFQAAVVEPSRFIVRSGVLAYVAARPFETMNAAAALFALLLVWPLTRTLGLPYGLLVLVLLLPPLAAGGLLSLGRFTAVLFPLFLWLGSRIPAGHRTAWVSSFAMCQALGAALFFTWRPLY